MASNFSMIMLMGILSITCVVLVLVSYLFSRYRAHLNNEQIGFTPVEIEEITREEKRQAMRADIQWPLEYEYNGVQVQAKTQNISSGGIFIICDEPLPLGEKFTIILSAPDRDPLLLNVEVLWNNKNLSPEKVVNRGMAVRFIGIPENERRYLNSIILAHFSEEEEKSA